MNIFPNPAAEQATLDVSIPESATVDVVLQNVAGQTLRMLKIGWQVGNGENQLPFSLSNLGPGMYWVVVKGDGFVVSKAVQRVE